MDKLKFTIHPLFFIFGLYFAFTGKVFSFLTYTLVAVIHELGHFYASEKLGYKLNRIVLMPYGALISGNLEDVTYKDEALIALSGPLVNVVTALFFVALWWFFPSIYPYTDLAVFASVSIAVINLLPCHPLDGGRFLSTTLSLFIKRSTAVLITRIIGVIIGLLILALFIYSCFTEVNFSVLFFAGFILVGAIDKNKQNSYIKTLSLYVRNVTRPSLVCEYVLPYTATLKTLYDLMEVGKYYRFFVFNNSGELSKAIEGKELETLLTTAKPYDKIIDAMNESAKTYETAQVEIKGSI